MSDALSHYYGSRDPLGMDGDFITAPEISQLFGEMIGIWAVQQWINMGSPSSFNLIELGPGRGTLMADLLRGTQHIPAFHNAMHVHMVEMSDVLREKQKETLCPHCEEVSSTKQSKDRNQHCLDWFVTSVPRNNVSIKWHNHLSEISNDTPTIIIANEFFDALPIRQFKYEDGEWLERYIEGNETRWLHYSQSSPSPQRKGTPEHIWKEALPGPKRGDIFEYSSMQEDYAKLIATYSGAAVIIDYGYVKSTYGDSLQALHKHKPCAITDHIGEVDLTSHIDFEWLASFFKNTKIKTQAQFLQENGIAIRYQQLNNPTLRSGYERLLHQDQMGKLFKVLEVIL